MSRATVDLQRVRFFLGYGLIFFGQHILTIVAATAILFVLDWRDRADRAGDHTRCWSRSRTSTRGRRTRSSASVQQRMADMTTVAEENIVGVNVVKAFAQEPQEEDKFARRNEAVFAESVRATRQRAFYVPLLSFLPLLAQAAVLLVGGHRVVNGNLEVGEFVAFNVYVLLLVMPLRMLGMWIGMSQRAIASGERIFEVLDEAEDDRRTRPTRSLLPAGEGHASLRARHVRLRPRPPGAPRRRPRRRGRAGRWR